MERKNLKKGRLRIYKVKLGYKISEKDKTIMAKIRNSKWEIK